MRIYRNLFFRLTVSFCVCGTGFAQGNLAPQNQHGIPEISVCFTPQQDCTAVIINLIDATQSTIYVQAYSITSQPIVAALIRAFKRGVRVKVIVDKSQKTDPRSQSHTLIHAGVPTWVDSMPGIAHNKVMVLDKKTVIGGSFNFTKAAQKRNAENVLILKDPVVAKQYLSNWIFRKNHSVLFAMARSAPPSSAKSANRNARDKKDLYKDLWALFR